MMKRKKRWLMTIAGCLLMVAAGCGMTANSRFYFLNPLTPEEITGTGLAADALSIGIGPVVFPDYLDRPQIMVRAGQNRMAFSDFEKWSEPLEGNFARVLAENLSLILGTDRIAHYPFRNLPNPDYQLPVRVTRLDGASGGESQLKVSWTLLKGKERKLVMMKRSTYRQSSGQNGVETMVSAQSRMVGDFSREVAEAIAKDAGFR